MCVFDSLKDFPFDKEEYELVEGWCSGKSNRFYGMKHTEESKVKFRENNKGEKNPNYGKTQSKETKEKVKSAKIGKKLWNNGEQQKFSKECPGEGWVLGGLKFKKSINNSKTNDGNE